jgi:hypothetical protein
MGLSKHHRKGGTIGRAIILFKVFDFSQKLNFFKTLVVVIFNEFCMLGYYY